MLNIKDTVLVVIDVQGKLASLMHGKPALYENLQKMIQGVRVLNIPILWVEQNPRGLGPTVPEIADLLTGMAPIAKTSFSAYGSESFVQALKASGCRQVLVAGIEAHVCVYQTVMDLISADYGVHVLADAVSSRTRANKHLALQKMTAEGACLTGVEMALFELIEKAEGERFKQVLKIVK